MSPATAKRPKVIGRPTKVDQVVGYRRADDGTEHPVTAAERIVAALEMGNYVEAAAASAGVTKHTVYDWLRQGADAHAKAAKGEKLTAQQRRMADFSDAVDLAQHRAQAHDIALLDQLASGVLERVIVTEKVGPDGKAETTTRREKLGPDAQVLMWRLERRNPAEWGRRRLEVSGPDGEAVPVEVRIPALVESLRRLRDERANKSDPIDAASRPAADPALEPPGG